MTIYNNTTEHYYVTDIQVKNVLERSFCVFDLEATGIDYNNEQITQIGAIFVDKHGILYKNTFESFVKPLKPIPAEIERFTSITNSMVADAPAFPETFESFKGFIEDSILIAQCGFEYTYALLDNECFRHKKCHFQMSD